LCDELISHGVNINLSELIKNDKSHLYNVNE
jgi:hypothetical protein